MKKVARIFGVSTVDAAQLEVHDVRTVLDLARHEALPTLSAQSGIPVYQLEQWRRIAQREVSATRLRWAAAATGVLVTVLGVVALAARAPRRAVTSTDLSYMEAVARYNDGDSIGAAHLLDSAFLRGEDSPRLHNLRGVLYQRAEQLEPAMREYRKAVALDSTYGDAWKNLGNVYLALRDTGRAISYYKKALASDPSDPRSYVDLSSLYQAQGDSARARATVVRGTERNPQSPEAFAALGAHYEERKAYAAAGDAYRKAATLGGDSVSNWRHAARAFREAAKWDDALAAYREILRLVPDDWDAHFYLAWVLLRKGKGFRPVSIRAFEAALAAAPGDVRNKWTYLNLAIAYASEPCDSSLQKADSALGRALKLDPEFAPALVQLGYLLEARGEPASAQLTYERALRADPDYTLAYVSLYQLYLSSSESDSAEAVRRRLVARAPQDRYAQLLGALAHEHAEQYAPAIAAYRKALSDYPGDEVLLMRLAAAEMRAGQHAESDELIRTGLRRMEEALAKDSTLSGAYFMLGWAYQLVPQIRDLERSQRLYEKAFTYDPRDVVALNNLSFVEIARGDLTGAARLAEQILQLERSNPNGLKILGYVAFLQGQIDSAIMRYDAGLAVARKDPGLLNLRAEARLWGGAVAAAHQDLALAREVLGDRETTAAEYTWIRAVPARYVPDGTRRVVYYYSWAHKRAYVDLLDAVTYLRDNKVGQALRTFEVATKWLTRGRDVDDEVVHKAVADVSRLRQSFPELHAAEVGLGYLWDWLGDHPSAADHWRRYLERGGDSAGVTAARKALSR